MGTDNSIPLFVYGTLKRGNPNHHYLDQSTFVGPASTTKLYALRIEDLPMADRETPVSPIWGEVYLISADLLKTLDEFENHPEWYRRELVPVVTIEGGTMNAWLYFCVVPKGPIEPSGNYG